MMDRDKHLMNLRPVIESSINGSKNEIELFMHQTLRPLLKFQHHLICSIISHEKYLKLSGEDLLLLHAQLNEYIQKNTILRTTLIGTIIGFFTKEELAIYFTFKKQFNKRIIEMAVTRYISTRK